MATDGSAVGLRRHVLEGQYHVRVFSPAWKDAGKLFDHARDAFELRRHALKLRYWPEQNPVSEAGNLLDLNWSWVRSLRGTNVGELRIDDTIGRHDNLRVIFYCGDPEKPDPNSRKPIIWILHVMQKKRDDFSKANITIFDARRKLVDERFYKHYEQMNG